MLALSALILACCIPSNLPKEEKLTVSIFSIEFEENTLSINDNSLIHIFNSNRIILNAVSIEINSINPGSKSGLKNIHQIRLARLNELLEAEGADTSIIKTKIISDKNEINRLKLNQNIFQVSITYPEKLISGLNPRRLNPLCNVDTTIYDNSGNGISLKLCDLLSNRESIKLSKAPSIRELNEVSNQDIEVLNRFKFVNENEVATEILLPTHPGHIRSSMQLEEFSLEHKRWINQGASSIQIKNIGRVTFISTKITTSGIYRITSIPKSKSDWKIIHAPEGYGILSAMVNNSDSISFPAIRILGGNAVAFMINKSESNYNLGLKLISFNGAVSTVESIPLIDCYKKTISTKRWEYSRELRSVCGSRMPNKAGIIESKFIK